jgi:hypothetical protein
MYIDWATLAVVAVVAAAAAVTVVLLVAFALVGLSARAARRAGDPGRSGGVTSRTRPDGGTVVAVLCVLAAALIVCYGLYLIVV